MTKYLNFLFVIVAVFHVNAAEWKTDISRPGITVLSNENGEWGGVRASSLAPLSNPAARVRKVFELDQLPAGTLNNAKQAALLIHLGILDYSLEKPGVQPNGLNEEFVIEINGHPLTFSTGDPRFPAKGIPSGAPSDADSIGIQHGQTARRLHDWVEISFPPDWLNPGKATVELYKKPSAFNDDFVCVGIDISADNHSSSFSFDGGKTWKTGPGGQPPGKGEYLMRLSLSSTAEKISFIDHDEPVDLAPAVNPPRGQRGNLEPSCRISGNEAVVSNRALTAKFQLSPFPELRSLIAAEAGRDLIRYPGLSRLFRVKSGNLVYDARNAAVRKIVPLPDGFTVEFDIAETPLSGIFSCRATDDELRFELEFENRGGNPFDFMPAFPHFSGIAISDDPADDYFLFPHGGGTLSNRNSALRSVYGTDGCWWQMIDLFSPERGAGLYLRCDDPKAIYKGFALRKGRDVKPKYILRHSTTPGRDPRLQFTDALEELDGIGISIDYQQFTRNPGARLMLPAACLGTHSGNWKNAMARYAAWSKKTWPPRPASKLLAPFWNLQGGVGHTLGSAAFSSKYLTPAAQIIEQDSYWTLSECAPWGSSWEDFDRAMEAQNRPRVGWNDPVTGKRLYPFNRGDYDGFNPDWGGLPAFQSYIQEIKQSGRPFTLYTDPVIACHNTKNGQELAKKYGIINPDWRDERAVPFAPKPPLVTAYHSYCLDLNAAGYPEWIAATMARLCRDTGADGIRLDEYGHRGYICYAKNHQHLFGEFGQNCWLEAVCHSIELVRKEFDKINPELVIMTEFPGHDRMAALLDGALSYNTCRRISPLAPLPLNLFRMYFPECKLFEISVNGPPKYWNYAMWNGMGTCYPVYPMRYLRVLNQYTKIFSGDFESLVPTQKKYVYANCFTEPDTQNRIYTLFNMTGNRYDGPVLAAKPGFRYVDLFAERELPVDNGTVGLTIDREKLGVIGEFPGQPATPNPAPAKPDSGDISELDSNFKTRTIQGENLQFRNALAAPEFEITGFGWRKTGGELYRLPENSDKTQNLSAELLRLAYHTAGGAIRFTTDARRIAIRAKLRRGFDMNHMPRSGSGGFDFYIAAGTGHDMFFRNVPVSSENINGKILENLVFRTPAKERNFSTWTIYLPLYSGVEILEIGVEPEAAFRPNPPWKIAKPVVFYGSSITQGGCASRPGNLYSTLLCRTLDAPQINLGFSGNAKGEAAMAKLIAELDMAAFVLDYDYNSPDAKHLAETHEKFFQTVRKAHPKLPVIILSRCTLYSRERTEVIRRTYENAVASGDRFVRFVDGSTLIDPSAKNAATVDNCHPNDLGFYLMYRKLLPVFIATLGQETF